MRNPHRWSDHAIVLTVCLNICRVCYTGSYTPPCEFNWGIGVTLLLMTLLLSFTGYLLPWDQLSLWAVTVGTNMAKYAPIAGPQTRFGMLGSYTVGNATILRFYVVPVLGLPLLASIAMMGHFWGVRTDGFSGYLCSKIEGCITSNQGHATRGP